MTLHFDFCGGDPPFTEKERALMTWQLEGLRQQLSKTSEHGNARSWRWLRWKIASLEHRLSFPNQLLR